jgi:hypothetical protein
MYAVKDSSTTPRVTAEENAVREHADWMTRAPERRATYARVQAAELQGLWRLDGNRTILLTDAYLTIERIVRPHQDNTQAKYSTKILVFRNVAGDVRRVECRNDQIINGELADRLDGFASFPAAEKHRRQFAEAVMLLGRESGTQIQDQVDALGWNRAADSSLVWTLANGTETLSGFIAAADSACIAPSLPNPNNGYFGGPAEPLAPREQDYWNLLLEQYAPHHDAQMIMLALLSLSALVQLPPAVAPEGIGIRSGTLELSPDIIGPSRHGKSRTINAILGLFGTRFRWNSNPLLSAVGGGDTRLGRGGVMSLMRYQLYADRDHKARPGMPEFAADHKLRADTIVNYVEDGGTGGSRARRTGGTEQRAAPAGCNVRTANYDHAIASIAEQNDMVENRACSFIWPEEIKGDDDISIMLDSLRGQAYATGQEYRRWLMRWMFTPDLFGALLDKYYEQSRAATDAYEWHSDYHRNHAALLGLGCLVWHRFLIDCYPSPWFGRWIDSHIFDLVADRSARSLTIRAMIEQENEESSVAQFVLEQLQQGLSNGALYIRSQSKNLLDPVDVEPYAFTLDDLGYHSSMRDDIEEWQPGRQCIGYLVHGGSNIAIKTKELMVWLRREATARGIRLGTSRAFLAALAEADVIEPGSQSHLRSIKIGARSGWYMVVPVAVLVSDDQSQSQDDQSQSQDDQSQSQDDQSQSQEPATRPDAPCVCGSDDWQPIRRDRRFVWICVRCGSARIARATPAKPPAGIVDFDEMPDFAEEEG